MEDYFNVEEIEENIKDDFKEHKESFKINEI